MAGYPCEVLIWSGWPLQCKTREQGKLGLSSGCLQWQGATGRRLKGKWCPGSRNSELPLGSSVAVAGGDPQGSWVWKPPAWRLGFASSRRRSVSAGSPAFGVGARLWRVETLERP